MKKKYFKIENERYFTMPDQVKIHTLYNFTNENFDKQKPLLIFNYGLVCNHQHWQEQLPYFDKLGFQILIHDYRYHHKSSVEGSIQDCTFKKIVEDIACIAKSFETENIILLGHSMGVNICLEFAKKYPELVKANILISGTVLPPQGVMFDSNITEIISPYLKFIQTKYKKAFELFWKNSHKSSFLQKIILSGGFNTKKVSQEFVELYMKKMGELPHDIFLHLLQEMHDQEILSHLKDIECPSLIIGGDKDKVIPNFLQYILSDNISSSELYIIKDGSHVPQVDFPLFTNERILRFLEKHSLLV